MKGLMMIFKKNYLLLIVGLLVLFFYSGSLNAKEAEVIKMTERESFKTFENFYRYLRYRYYRDVEPAELINQAIKSIIRDQLDPHSYYYEDKGSISNLMIHTKGEYGGLGTRVSMQDGLLTIISPMYNSPAIKAGILPGDQIIKIDGVSTKGTSLDELVNTLRGQIGTEVTLTIKRGDEPFFDITVIRDKIVVPSIPYYGVHDNVGYIHLVDFSKKTEGDLYQALTELKNQNVEGIIIDLRNNPGGLLDQAVKVVEMFVGADKVVVKTKGKTQQMYHEWLTEGEQIYNGKLAVLVNRGSASASEIVAGAIQDYDRGVVIGTNTFGKGSVQNILPLDLENQERMLKLTTSHYYIPSGRCIHKISDYGKRNKDEEKTNIDSLKKIVASQKNEKISTIDFEDSLFAEIVKEQNYQTLKGRTVKAGDGISPDIIVKDSLLSAFATFFRRKNAFFKFVVDYRKTHPEQERIEVNNTMYENFIQFCQDQEITYESPSQATLKKLKEEFTKENYSDSLQILSINIEKLLNEETKKYFEKNRSELEYLIKQQLALQIGGETAIYPLQFDNDPVFLKALEIIKNENEYSKILTANP